MSRHQYRLGSPLSVIDSVVKWGTRMIQLGAPSRQTLRRVHQYIVSKVTDGTITPAQAEAAMMAIEGANAAIAGSAIAGGIQAARAGARRTYNMITQGDEPREPQDGRPPKMWRPNRQYGSRHSRGNARIKMVPMKYLRKYKRRGWGRAIYR